MFEIFQFEFIQRALFVSIAASICCGIVGTLVVINRLSFLAGGIAHAAYGGIGLATFFSLPFLATTIAFSLFSALLMGAASIKQKSRTDATIGVLWAAGMALGVVLVDLTPGYQGDLMSFLFGSILTVSQSDLAVISVLVLVIVLVAYLFFKDFVSLSFEEEFARTRGVSVNIFYFLLLALVSVTVVITIQVVGLILVIALLTIPPMMAEKSAGSLSGMMLLSTLWSLLFCFSGLFLSYALDITAGATIIAVATLCFLLHSLLVRSE